MDYLNSVARRYALANLIGDRSIVQPEAKSTGEIFSKHNADHVGWITDRLIADHIPVKFYPNIIDAMVGRPVGYYETCALDYL